MTKYEKFGLNAVARLVDPVTSGDVTIEVTTIDRFPTDGNFRITIGTEILLVTSITGTIFTAVRGYEGTTALAHDGGAPVQQTITAGGLERAMLDAAPLARDSARPMLNTLVDDTGGALALTDFTWVNQGAATASDLDSGGISLIDDGTSAGANLRMLTRTAPTAPYTITAAFIPQLNNTGNMGIGFRRASNGYTTQVISIAIDQTAVLQYSAPSTFDSQLFVVAPWPMSRQLQWMQIENDNTDIFYRIGMDGVNWQELHTHAKAAQHNSLEPDEVFFHVSTISSTLASSMAMIAWEES